MKGSSEARLGAALQAIDLRLYAHKLGDRDLNWKPCDYLVWWYAGFGPTQSSWWEVKDTDAVNAFPFRDLRPSQLQGIRDAANMGIPYWLAIYWQRHKAWTISDAAKVVLWKLEQDGEATELSQVQTTSVPRTLLMSRFGLESSPANLSSNIKAVILGEAS